MEGKIDISSTTIDKGLDVAKEFLQKLIGPSLEEAGLLLKESIALWRFRNQVSILEKANEICRRKGINPSPVSLKLLCPLMDAASLEEDPDMQSKWAALLSNMVDSEKNIQNHVFPYILGQLSLAEFALLEACIREKRKRVRSLSQELELFNESFPAAEQELIQKMADYDQRIGEQKELPHDFQRMKTISDLSAARRKARFELMSLKNKARQLEFRIADPQVIPDGVLRDFKMSNLTRLGLAKFLRETFAEPVQIDIPIDPEDHHVSTEADVVVAHTDTHIVTELAELLIVACSEEWDV
ncbi:hypothetical protein NZK32_17255 [Cyanobium sp. FGCU-52]|nr:hypothetical protein [Cyanobium sp. FGCU52]